MRHASRWMACATALTLALGAPARADDGAFQKELDDLRERISRLEREKSGGPSFQEDRFRFFGYGEAHWNDPKTGTMAQRDPAQGDFHRLVLGWQYDFADWVHFHTEVEYEHAGGTIELEYAEMDFALSDHVTATVGALLMPVGMLNEYHEPTLFWSVERPYVEKSVIPTTWQELGFGVKTRFMEERLKYRAYVVSAVDATKFTAADGIRGGRGGGGRSTNAEDQAFVHRAEFAPELDLDDLQMDVGASHYWAPRANHGQRDTQGVGVSLYEADARLRAYGFDLRGSYALIDLADAAQLNRALRTSATGTIGSKIAGWYVDLGYHVLPLFVEDSDQDVVIFIRNEWYDTNHDTQGETIQNEARDVNIVTTGVAYFPVKNVALKGDVEHWDDKVQDKLTRVNLGIAFTF